MIVMVIIVVMTTETIQTEMDRPYTQTIIRTFFFYLVNNKINCVDVHVHTNNNLLIYIVM